MKASYIMVGGFLGAGKTTALLRAAEILTALHRPALSKFTRVMLK